MDTIVIIQGARAERYFEIGDDGKNLDRLIAAGIIRPATDAELERLSRLHAVYYARGGQWGSGEYVLNNADKFYTLVEDFNFGHLDLAIRRMLDKQREAKRQDLFNRIDGTL